MLGLEILQGDRRTDAFLQLRFNPSLTGIVLEPGQAKLSQHCRCERTGLQGATEFHELALYRLHPVDDRRDTHRRWNIEVSTDSSGNERQVPQRRFCQLLSDYGLYRLLRQIDRLDVHFLDEVSYLPASWAQNLLIVRDFKLPSKHRTAASEPTLCMGGGNGRSIHSPAIGEGCGNLPSW